MEGRVASLYPFCFAAKQSDHYIESCNRQCSDFQIRESMFKGTSLTLLVHENSNITPLIDNSSEGIYQPEQYSQDPEG